MSEQRPDEERAAAYGADDHAVHDALSAGATEVPAVGKNQQGMDRARFEDLRAVRLSVQNLVLPEVSMQTTWNHVQHAARTRRGLMHFISRHAVKIMVACMVCAIGLSAMWLGMPTMQYNRADVQSAMDARSTSRSTGASIEAESSQTATLRFSNDVDTAPDVDDAAFNTMIRSGSITLRHETPAALQQQVVSEIETLGGTVLKLSRTGAGDDISVSLQLRVPTAKFRSFVSHLETLGEVIAQNEAAEDATADMVNYEALLAEAQEYLRSLEELKRKGSDNLNDLTRLEENLRTTRQSIGRYAKALEHINRKTSTASFSVSIYRKDKSLDQEQTGIFASAWNDGTEALNRVLAFMLKATLAVLPVLIVIALVFLFIRKRGS